MHALLLRGGTVLDGTGTPGFIADVGIDEDGTIAEVGRIADRQGRRVLDVSGAVVCPGFIDLHSHADYSVFGAPAALTQAYQGVTTLITGNCGFSPFPLADEHAEEGKAHKVFGGELPWNWRTAGEFMDVVDALPLGVNIGCLVGHGALRIAAMGPAERAATPTERDRMRQLLRQSADDGVLGMSSGLIYAPGSFSSSNELVELCTEVASRDLLYATHMRDEGDRLLAAIDEAIDTARRSSAAKMPVRLEISHLKAIGPANWGNTTQALAAIEAARASGLDVATDVYPYTASSTTLTARLPNWALDGGTEQLLCRLADPAAAEKVANELAQRIGTTILPAGVIIADTPPGPYRQYVGHSLADIAERLRLDPAHAIVELLRGQRAAVSIVNHAMSDEDLDAVLQYPQAAVASDGAVLATSGESRPHPRSFGAFTRVLGHYVRDRGLLELPDAVRKMTSLPASRLGWKDRGVIRPGAVADLCVFDPATVVDRSSYDQPWQLAGGVLHTLLAGRAILENGTHTDSSPGRVIRGRSERTSPIRR